MNFKLLSILVFLSLFISKHAIALSLSQDSFLVKIDIQEKGNISSIKGVLSNKIDKDVEVKYSMDIERSGKNGTTNNKQSGTILSPKQNEVVLSETNLNINEDDYYKISINVFFNNQLIAQNSVEKGTKPSNVQKLTKTTKKQLAPTDDIELDGFIIDATRTKVGRDFYTYFYNSWVAPKGAKNYTITIKELPARGRLARLTVLINNKEVVQRFLQPRNDLIKATAEQAVNIVHQQLLHKAALDKQLINEDQKGSGIF